MYKPNVGIYTPSKETKYYCNRRCPKSGSCPHYKDSNYLISVTKKHWHGDLLNSSVCKYKKNRDL